MSGARARTAHPAEAARPCCTPPCTIDPAPLVLEMPGVASNPQSLTAADIDGNGYIDLVSAKGNSTTVFFQTSPGLFSVPLVLGGPGVTPGAASAAAADVDGDGDLDIVSTNDSGVTVFWGGR